MNANCAARLAVSAVSASVEQEGNEAPHAIDGSLATRWSGKGIGATLTADLGALRQLCGVGLGWYVGDTRSNTFTLETSTDGTTFTRVFSGISARTTALQTVGFAQTSARWLRLAVLGNTENTWASVTELQPFGATPFVLRQTRPDATNTGAGVIRPYPTAVIDGDVTLTTNGAVFADKIVHGRIIVKAADVTISNVVVVGGDALPQNSHWLIDTHSGTNTRIEFTTVRAAHPNTHVNGIGYRNFTAYRVDVSGVVDAFSAIPVSSGANVNISIQGSYGHDLVHFSPDPGHPGPDSRTHNDVIQSHGGNGLQVIGSNFSAYHDPELGTQPAPHSQLAAMMINTGIGPSSGLDIEDNWLGGGAYCVNGGGAIGGGGRFLRNRFDRGMATPKGQPDAAFTLVFDATFTQTSTGNVFEDNGHPVQVRTNY